MRCINTLLEIYCKLTVNFAVKMQKIRIYMHFNGYFHCNLTMKFPNSVNLYIMHFMSILQFPQKTFFSSINTCKEK